MATKAKGVRTAPSKRPKGLVSAPSAAGNDQRPLTQQYLRVGPQNPAGVSAILQQADTGYPWRMCDLFEEYRNKDSHLQTVTSRRERALADVPWQMIPASDKRRDLKIAAWVEDVVKAMGSARMPGVTLRGFADAVIHLNSGVVYGFSVGEVPWLKDGIYVKPAGFMPMGQRRFVFSQFDTSLRWYDMNGPATVDGHPMSYPGLDPMVDFPEGHFLSHRPRINGAIGTREGLIRCLIWATMFRLWTVADWHRSGEQAWKPYRIGTYKKGGMVDEDRRAIEEACQYLTSMGFAAIPDSVKLEICYPKNRSAGDGGVHGGLAAFLAAEMSKVALGATLAVEQGAIGSNALGNVHENVERRVRDADARSMEETIQRQLIAPLVRFNFGDVPLPIFRFVTEEGADLTALALAIEKLSKIGLQIPAKWVRATFGMPEPEVGDELLNGMIRRDMAEVAAEAESARREKGPTLAPAPAAKPAIPDDAAANEGGPPVSDKALKAAYHTYVTDQILSMAGVRARSNFRPANDIRGTVAA